MTKRVDVMTLYETNLNCIDNFFTKFGDIQNYHLATTTPQLNSTINSKT